MKNNKIVLMFHDVYEKTVMESGFQTEAANRYKISKDKFLKQIQAIKEYCVSRNVLKDDIVFTFDDGGSSFYSIIAPILKEFGFKGYFFISTANINTKGFLTSEQVVSLQNAGHIIGAHTHTHPGMLNRLTLNELEEEWTVSIEILSELLKTKIVNVSIPGGSFSKEMGNILANKEVEYIFTSKPTNKIECLRDNCKIIGRYTILNDTEVSQIINLFCKISLERLKQKIKWDFLSVFKYLLGDNYLNIRKYLLK